MSNELIESSIVSGTKAVKTFSRNGLEIPVSPIPEYIRFYKRTLTQGVSLIINYTKSDLELLHLHVKGGSLDWSVDVKDDYDVTYFSHSDTDSYLLFNNLLLPRNHKVVLISNSGILDYLILVTKQVSVIEDVALR